MNEFPHGPEASGIFPAGAAVVAGGAGGIGQGICEVLARQGSAVAVLYRRSEATAQELVARLTAAGAQARAWPLDLQDADATRATLDAIGEHFGRIHTAVYSAGPAVGVEYLGRVEAAEFLRHILGDVVACFNFLQAALPHLRQQGGALVGVTTDQLERLEFKGGLSTIPKGAVDKMILTVAKEEARHGVRATTVRPGWIAAGLGTQVLARRDPAAVKALEASIPLGRFGVARDIGEAVAFLASNRATYISGVSIAVNGGRHV